MKSAKQKAWNAFTEWDSINHWESDQDLLRYINGMPGRWSISFRKLWLKSAHDKVRVEHFSAPLEMFCFFLLRPAHYLKQSQPVKVAETNLYEFYPHATSSLSCWNTPRNLEGTAVPRSVDLCGFVKIRNHRKNVNNVEARGRLMASLQCQSIPGSVCGWLSMWQI